MNINALDLSEPINYMIQEKYIKIEPNTSLLEGDELTLDKLLVITHLGRIALEKELKSIKKYKYTEIRAWITLAIAITAFIKSFFY